MRKTKNKGSFFAKKPFHANNMRRCGVIVCLLLFFLYLRLAFFVGIGINDDMGYIHHARALSEGSNIIADGGSQLAFRLGMILPLTVAYKIFGYNEHSFSAYPLLSSLCTCIFIYLTAYILWGYRAAIFSALLWVVYPLQIVFDTQLSPSNQHAMCISAALFLFFVASRGSIRGVSRNWHAPILLAMSGGFLGIGWMINELFVVMGIIVFPMLIVLKPRPQTIVWILFGFSIVILTDFVIAKCASGSFLARIPAIMETEKAVVSNKATSYLPRVLFRVCNTNPLHDEGHFGFLWYAFIAFTLLAILQKQWVSLGLAASVWLVLGYLQWGVISFDGSPITKYIRYLSMIVPLQCLAIGGVLARLSQRTWRWRWVINLLFGFLVLHLCFSGASTAMAVRIYTNDFRKIASFLLTQKKDGPAYMDETSAQFVELFSKSQLNIKCVEGYLDRFPPETGYLVVDGSRGIVENSEYRSAMPSWYLSPLDKWELLHVVKGKEDTEVFGNFDPKIYRITSSINDGTTNFEVQ